MSPSRPDGASRSPDDRRRTRQRSLAIALTLAFLVLLLYAVTIAKLGPQVLVRPL